MYRRTLLIVSIVSLLGTSTTLAATLSPSQTRWYANALQQQGQAGSAMAAEPDAVAEKLLQWNRLRDSRSKPGFPELSAFLLANPGWPEERALRLKAEQAIADSAQSDQTVLDYFQAFPALTGTGKLRHAELLLRTGQSAQATALAREAWTRELLPPSDEALLLSHFGSSLTPEDDVQHADLLLWNDQIAAASRSMARLDHDHQLLAQTRIALKSNAKDVHHRLAQVPEALKSSPGLIYDQARWLERRGQPHAAIILLRDSKPAPGAILRPALWVNFRQSLATMALKEGAAADAYQLLAQHGLLPQEPEGISLKDTDRTAYVETEWRAGWIALRYLRRPNEALPHFQAVERAAKSPITLARAAYWAGRAAEAMNNGALAQTWYGRAGQFPDFFYGQLSIEKLGRPIPAPDLTPPLVSANQLRDYERRDIVRAARMLGELGRDDLQTLFINTLAASATSPEEQRVAADLAIDIQRPDLGVRIGKLARTSGSMLAYVAYPRLTLPSPARAIWSMVHAITRQESIFNAMALSHSGARGLMQLMPATARGVSQKLGLPFTLGRLTSDPDYNVTLGATYIQERLDSYGGNAVLAVAAYNAGPGNVAKWLVTNGDPRDPGVDVIDWIEQIPLPETRDYVMRVLENAVVYSLIEPGRSDSKGYGILSGLLGRVPGRAG